MTRQSRFNVDQHKAASRQVKLVRKRLLDLASDLSRYYRTTGCCYQATIAALQAVDVLRSRLDRQISRECPDDPSVAHVYYTRSTIQKGKDEHKQ